MSRLEVLSGDAGGQQCHCKCAVEAMSLTPQAKAKGLSPSSLGSVLRAGIGVCL